MIYYLFHESCFERTCWGYMISLAKKHIFKSRFKRANDEVLAFDSVDIFNIFCNLVNNQKCVLSINYEHSYFQVMLATAHPDIVDEQFDFYNALEHLHGNPRLSQP